MKVTIQKIIIVFMLLVNTQFVLAADPTPPPPTPPPGLPIDGGVVAMFFIALILGYILTKKYITIKKSSL
jgi:hypothetical protein